MAILALAGVGLAACGAHAESGAEELGRLSPQLISGAGAVRSVTAEGSGCPEGTWEAAIADDGQSVKVVFDDFDGAVSKWQPRDSETCTLSIRLSGHADTAYAPATVSVSGVAQSVLHQTGKVYWSNAPQDERSFSSSGGGNVNSTFPAGDLWSPCNGTRELRVVLGASSELRSRGRSEEFRIDQARVRFAARSCAELVPPVQPDAGSLPDAGPIDRGEVDAGPIDTGKVDAGPTVTPVLPSNAGFRIENVVFTGDCRTNSTANIDASAQSYDADVLVTSTGNLAYCSILTQVLVPAGKQVAIASARAGGMLDIVDTAQARVSIDSDVLTTVRAQGEATSYVGPKSEPFDIEKVFSDMAFTPCEPGTDKIIRLTIRPFVGQRSDLMKPGAVTLKHVGPVRFVERDCPVSP